MAKSDGRKHNKAQQSRSNNKSRTVQDTEQTKADHLRSENAAKFQASRIPKGTTGVESNSLAFQDSSVLTTTIEMANPEPSAHSSIVSPDSTSEPLDSGVKVISRRILSQAEMETFKRNSDYHDHQATLKGAQNSAGPCSSKVSNEVSDEVSRSGEGSQDQRVGNARLDLKNIKNKLISKLMAPKEDGNKTNQKQNVCSNFPEHNFFPK